LKTSDHGVIYHLPAHSASHRRSERQTGHSKSR